jgi:hypothetical protein
MKNFGMLFLSICLSACGNFAGDIPDGELQTNQKLSACGGFLAESTNALTSYTRNVTPPDPTPPEDYCSAETLEWSYDEDSGTLTFTNWRVLLNCCGEHNITAEWVEGALIITETDDPDEFGGRCGCMCVYDYSISISGIPSESFTIKIVRQVSDDERSSGQVFEGQIDLGQNAGTATIDDSDVYPWCEDGNTECLESCQEAGRECGTWSDRCGGELICGDCEAGQTCSAGRCVSSSVVYPVEISECNGFPRTNILMNVDPYNMNYCDAEVLYWTYDAQAQTLNLTNNRVILNCCGDHSIGPEIEDRVYIITITDAPDELGRCACMCVFDFSITLPEIKDSDFEMRLLRHVTDETESPIEILATTLDLSQTSGAIVISEEETPFCYE